MYAEAFDVTDASVHCYIDVPRSADALSQESFAAKKIP